MLAALLLSLSLPASAAVLEVSLDPRVELAAALELLGSSEPPRAFRPAGAYGAALLEGVRGCSDHPAVGAYARVRRGARPDWPAQALVELTTCLDDSLAVKSREECGRSALAASAADFARACGFKTALDKAAQNVAPALADLRAKAAEKDLLALFREYTGLEPGATRVAPSPLLEPGRFWNGLDREGRKFSIVSVISPAPGEPLRLRWRPVALEVWHENGHGVLDALAAPSAPPAGLKTASCYESWPQCVREHMAQGLALRMAQWSAVDGKLATPPSRHKNPRLPRHEPVADRLAEFEKNRARWPTLREFYPRWSEALGARPAPAAAAPARAAQTPPDPELSAAVALAASDPRAAEVALEALASRRPDDGGVLLSLAVLRRSSNKAAALALADRAVAAARVGGGAWLLPDALSTRAGWRREDGDAVGARVDLEEALAAAPRDWPRREQTRAMLSPASR